MKKLTTFALATLMLTGIFTAATSSPAKLSTKSVTLQDGGPVPLCDPYAQNCKIK